MNSELPFDERSQPLSLPVAARGPKRPIIRRFTKRTHHSVALETATAAAQSTFYLLAVILEANINFRSKGKNSLMIEAELYLAKEVVALRDGSLILRDFNVANKLLASLKV